MNLKTEVLIIGGGATGVGISRDLALRGIPSVLIEKGDFASGASGRNHGLLHSGGRYAVLDPEAARECIAENKILRTIAPHCIEETDGLFISLPDEGLDYRERFLRACEKVGIQTTLMSHDETLELEPELNPNLLSAVRVPDGAIDPFALVLENAKDAERHGAKILLHAKITSLILDGDKVIGAKVKDLLDGEEYTIEASYAINATGAWANQVLKLAGLHIGMALSKGSMLITNRRLTHCVINRCRPPLDGDIVVPNHTVSILGTTSIRMEEVEKFEVTSQEVSLLIKETSQMIPAIQETRFIRAYAGIRPLLQSEEKGNDRAISRGFVLIDHGKRDGIKNLITITGGKLMTYRLMAERTSDLICEKMGRDVPCSTHLKPLPGANPVRNSSPACRRDWKPSGALNPALRGGTPYGAEPGIILKSNPAAEQQGIISNGVNRPTRLKERLEQFSTDRAETVCDCELIPRKEVEEVLGGEKLKDLQDILHRTRLAKGTCQGGFCVYRLFGILHDLRIAEGDSNKILKEFLEERWKGIRPILWGVSLKEEELIESIYKGIFNL